ncbi:MAG: AbrB/MazE/SpoVT family DNA-binding domain-containing protein [Chloroflexi bacterium]|nr:AbrB/MazE/SpoVT family DNA-binding domain-containing protein [Chloroflexota bacterium]
MLIKLSSKGQLVIPKSIREALRLDSGNQMRVRIADGRIILEPISGKDLIQSLHGKYAGNDLLEELENEHRQEIARD